MISLTLTRTNNIVANYCSLLYNCLILLSIHFPLI